MSSLGSSYACFPICTDVIQLNFPCRFHSSTGESFRHHQTITVELLHESRIAINSFLLHQSACRCMITMNSLMIRHQTTQSRTAPRFSDLCCCVSFSLRRLQLNTKLGITSLVNSLGTSY